MSPNTSPVPVRKLHHVGVSVRSLPAALAWYEDVFGVRPEFLAGSEGPEVSAAVQVPGVVIDAAFLRIGDVYLELLEFREPRGTDFTLRNCDVGVIHIALDVPDIHQAYDSLTSKGVAFSNEPSYIPEGSWPVTGTRTSEIRTTSSSSCSSLRLERSAVAGLGLPAARRCRAGPPSGGRPALCPGSAAGLEEGPDRRLDLVRAEQQRGQLDGLR